MHFMVWNGIILGYAITKNGIEVDRTKVNLIINPPPPWSVKEMGYLLDHGRFYRQFVKAFSKIARPLTHLLAKNLPFNFKSNCLRAFEQLRKAFTITPIIHVPDWSLHIELMSEASNFVISLVLTQHIKKKPHVIY